MIHSFSRCTMLECLPFTSPEPQIFYYSSWYFKVTAKNGKTRHSVKNNEEKDDEKIRIKKMDYKIMDYIQTNASFSSHLLKYWDTSWSYSSHTLVLLLIFISISSFFFSFFPLAPFLIFSLKISLILVDLRVFYIFWICELTICLTSKALIILLVKYFWI